MTVMVSEGEIVLSGTVGDLYWDDFFTASDVIMALAQVGDANDVTIRLNSGGGIATEGSAIHSAIARHTGRTTVIVEGIAASAASLLAMAGDEVVMSLGAVMMIHDPAGITMGTAADHDVTIRALNSLGDAFASIYAAKSGRTAAECRADMQTEIWMTAEQAVELGYADRASGAEANDNAPDAAEPTAFDYRIYTNSPERLVALADARGWKARKPRAASSAATNSQRQEKSMATEPADKKTAIAPVDTGAARSDERTRIAAIMNCEEAKGREDLARHMAFETDMAADMAVTMLAKAPKAEAVPPAKEPNRFDAAMAAAGNPAVGADATDPTAGLSEDQQAAALALAVVATVKKVA